VRNILETQRGGKPSRRIGCQFVKLSNAMENQLQRFITDVQREERARLGS
jgi:c-di-GMP-binding flagellar brake protein YcgR